MAKPATATVVLQASTMLALRRWANGTAALHEVDSLLLRDLGLTMTPAPRARQSPVLRALYRLKARLGRERGRFLRFYKQAEYQSSKDRAGYEMNICDLAIGFVDREIKRAKAG